MPTENNSFEEILSYKKIHIHILDCQVCKFITKQIASIKALWRSEVVDKESLKVDENMNVKPASYTLDVADIRRPLLATKRTPDLAYLIQRKTYSSQIKN